MERGGKSKFTQAPSLVNLVAGSGKIFQDLHYEGDFAGPGEIGCSRALALREAETGGQG